MAVTHRYPVGIADFEQIRKGNYLYIDKTAAIHRMVTEGGNSVFLSRPRRFGKSLLVSTLQAYFEGRRELFKGLAIDTLQPEEWESYPVLRFDLSTVKATSMEKLERDLNWVLRRAETVWGRDPEIEGWSGRVGSLIERAHEATGKPVVVLVDEYDAPLLTVMDDPALLAAFREEMREFYASFKALGGILRFVFLTGITKFSQLSIFSELNNLNLISMVPAYAGVCGITEHELLGQMEPDIAHLATLMNVTFDEAFHKLKTMYDGYHFCENSPDIYNPFSLMNAFQKGKIDSYWFASGTPTALIRMIEKSGTRLMDLENIRARASTFESPTDSPATLIPFMYQAGYLTIKGFQEITSTYSLGLPNEEVAEGLYEILLPVYAGCNNVAADSFLNDFTLALYEERDLGKALALLRSFLAESPYELAIRSERDFQNILYTIFRMVGFSIKCEVHIATGSIDAVIEIPDQVFIIELKYSRESHRKTAAEALAQIEEHGYQIPYETDKRRVVLAGVVFDERERTITETEIAEVF